MASEVKWIKIVTDIFDDEKILLIEALPEADSIIVIWFKMLCLAGKLNSCGVLVLNDKIVYTEEMLSQIFRRPLNVIRLALTTFERFGMIEIVNDTITIPNWEKHQNIEGMERIREQTRKRVAEYREREKQKLLGVTADVTLRNATDIDIDIERKKEKKNKEHLKGECEGESTKKPKRASKAFFKPTVEEIRAYCEERGNGIDPEEFFDKYEGNGWVDKNGNPMKDWKATIRTWERWRKENPQFRGGKNQKPKDDADYYKNGESEEWQSL